MILLLAISHNTASIIFHEIVCASGRIYIYQTEVCLDRFSALQRSSANALKFNKKLYVLCALITWLSAKVLPQLIDVSCIRFVYFAKTLIRTVVQPQSSHSLGLSMPDCGKS